VTICWAFVTPAAVPPDAGAEEPAEAAELTGALLELEPLEPQAASTTVAPIAATGATQRFHLYLIAFGSSIPPITSGA
jgi:hypothetical protein